MLEVMSRLMEFGEAEQTHQSRFSLLLSDYVGSANRMLDVLYENTTALAKMGILVDLATEVRKQAQFIEQVSEAHAAAAQSRADLYRSINEVLQKEVANA